MSWKNVFFFKRIRISLEIDWCYYQCACPAPSCIVRHQTMTKTPMRLSVTKESSVGGGALTGQDFFFFIAATLCQ